MATAWFLCPYKEDLDPNNPRRVCAMDDFTALITADGGAWRETEILGNRAIVKVRATPATLATIAAAPGVRRIPLARLDDPLSTLTPAQRTAIRNEILNAGYTVEEVTAALPNLTTATLRDVLRFMASRRVKTHFDATTNTFVFDGETRTPNTPDRLDKEILDD